MPPPPGEWETLRADLLTFRGTLKGWRDVLGKPDPPIPGGKPGQFFYKRDEHRQKVDDGVRLFGPKLCAALKADDLPAEVERRLHLLRTALPALTAWGRDYRGRAIECLGLIDDAVRALEKAGLLPPTNGLFGTNTFTWNGATCGNLTPIEYSFLSYLWNDGDLLAEATWQSLNDTVWKGRGRDGNGIEWTTMRSTICRLNNKLLSAQISLGLACLDASHTVRVRKFGNSAKI
jgi:hypothetical protein